MELVERVFSNQFLLLLIVSAPIIVIGYCIRNRPNLVKTIALAHLKKTDFKFVSNNIKDQIISVLFWSSLLLQIIFMGVFLDETNNFSTWIIVVITSLILGKRAVLFLFNKIFQTPDLSEAYFTSYIVMVIHLGWLTAPILLTKITYLSYLSLSNIDTINIVVGFIVLSYLFYRFFKLLFDAFQEKVSFLHIIFYLCTLEILPMVLILDFLIN